MSQRRCRGRLGTLVHYYDGIVEFKAQKDILKLKARSGNFTGECRLGR